VETGNPGSIYVGDASYVTALVGVSTGPFPTGDVRFYQQTQRAKLRL
jgi:hypothetical protein